MIDPEDDRLAQAERTLESVISRTLTEQEYRDDNLRHFILEQAVVALSVIVGSAPMMTQSEQEILLDRLLAKFSAFCKLEV